MPPQRVGFLHSFGPKTGIDFAHFGLESGRIGYDLRGNYDCVSMCLSFQFQMNKKEIATCKFENNGWILRNLFVAMMT